jgi:selenide,water dikinase
MVNYPVNACTDVTGFGLLGHLLEMATASRLCVTLFTKNVPLLPEALDCVQLGLVPAGSFANRDFCAHKVVQAEPVDPMFLDILADAQTSGGILISLPESEAARLLADLKAGGVPDAAMIGRATDGEEGTIELR